MHSRFTLTPAFASAFAALVLISAAGPAQALHGPRPRPEPICLEECRGARRDCAEACGAGFADCMSGPRVEAALCRDGCAAEFAVDSPELEACIATCREEILVPARQECRSQRLECRPLCHQGLCPDVCRPDGETPPVINECRRGCAATLEECAMAGKIALHECMAPCRQLTDEVEREACAADCAEVTRAGALACHEEFRSCATGCAAEPSATTTTIPEL